MKTQYSIFYGVRRARGGWLIKEQMVCMADNFQEAEILAKHFCKQGEEIFDIEAHENPPLYA